MAEHSNARCSCGSPGAKWTVHMFPEQGPCLSFSPAQITAILNARGGNGFTISPGLANAGAVSLAAAERARPVEVTSELLGEAGRPEPISQVMTFQSTLGYSKSARHIVEHILPEVVRFFLQKNRDYGDQHRYALGPKGEWVGIDRKISKLELAIWEGREMVGEGVQEMSYDVIGQFFLLLDLLDGNWEPRSRTARRAP